MKKVICLIIIISFTLTGCWDSTETEKLGVVSVLGIGLDSNNSIRVIIQELPHEKSAGGGTVSNFKMMNFYVFSESGDTISDALEKISAKQPFQTYFAHTKVIILDEDFVTQKGIKPVLDFLERSPEIRFTTPVLISSKGQLEKIISTDLGLETDTGMILEEIIRNKKDNSFFIVNDLRNILERLYNDGEEPFTAGVSINQKNSGNNKIIIRDTAVFKDMKMVGWLNDEEGRGLSEVNGHMRGGIMTIPLKDGLVSLKIVKMKHGIKPVVSNGDMKIIINIECTSILSESQNNLNFMDKEVIHEMQLQQKAKVKEEINALIDKTRKLDSDIIGFGNYFNMNYPGLWKNIKKDWYSYYPEIKVDFNMNIKLKSMGVTYQLMRR